jgi:hypothetical protein
MFAKELEQFVALSKNLPAGCRLEINGDSSGLLKVYLWKGSEILLSGYHDNELHSLGAFIESLESFMEGRLKIVEVVQHICKLERV